MTLKLDRSDFALAAGLVMIVIGLAVVNPWLLLVAAGTALVYAVIR